MATRVYYVVNKAGDERLVEAASPAQARSHAARDDYTVVVASQKRCVDMGKGGFKVEVAGEEPAIDPEG